MLRFIYVLSSIVSVINYSFRKQLLQYQILNYCPSSYFILIMIQNTKGATKNATCSQE